MSGPRISTGEDSKQDYRTPEDFMAAVVKRHGPIAFDLAAHRGNKQHANYFAPEFFIEKYDPETKKFSVDEFVESLVLRGARQDEAYKAIVAAVDAKKKCKVSIKNHDKEAYRLDAFKHSWSTISQEFKSPNGGPGLLWLNCEFSDIDPWAERCKQEAERGANILLLTPAAVGSNWYAEHVAGHASIDKLNGRLCFDGKNVFPKDCILSHYHLRSDRSVHVWRWRENKVLHSWTQWRRPS